jgi:cytochrome c553/transposase-like protein
VGRALSTLAAAWFIFAALATAAEPPASPPADGIEFFEKRIRPLLAEHCYQCHGPKKQESGLVLSTPDGLQNGGDRGSTIVPGDPDASVLVQAVRYTDDDLKMPPRGKLKDEQIADLVAWVKLGAALPKDEEQSRAAPRPSSDFNLDQRRQHWAYQPVGVAMPPLAGSIPFAGWNMASIDAFILARLDAAGLSPSPPATKRTLIRRATFDLTGLPPTPDEVSDFLASQTPDAYERLVDRLLASPRYGERFGRHWLDVVRYSESLGFEFDYDLHNAWRYRDYVIRAFNANLPYDQFVIEHLAGDLLPQTRRHSIDGTNESILATGFLWMHEGKQTPVDIRQDQADRIDNQLDVLGKAFLGQTIACARCHDHKFDAISTRDYYALAGYLRSSRYQQAFIDPPERVRPQIDELAVLRTKIQAEHGSKVSRVWLKQASNISRYLLAAMKAEKDDDTKVAEVAREAELDDARLKQWMKALADESLGSPDHPLHVWSQRSKPEATPNDELKATLQEQAQDAQRIAAAATIFEDFRPANVDGWFVTGQSFATTGVSPVLSGQAVIGDSAARPIARLTPGGVDSGLISNRLQGELRSRSFTIDKNFVHLRLAGKNSRVNLVIDGYTLIMNPMYGKLTVAPSSDRLVWRTMPVDRWVGHRAFIEASDSTIPMHGLNPPPSPARMPVGKDGYVVLDKIVFSDDPNPPAVPSSINQATLQQVSGEDLPPLAAAYQKLIAQAIEHWQSEKTTTPREQDDDIALLNWLLENGLLDSPAEQTSRLTSLIERFHKLESELSSPQRAPAIAAFAAVEATGTRQEVIELLWLAARRGSVSAMRLLLEELRRDGKKLATGGQASAPDFIDELARRRGR